MTNRDRYIKAHRELAAKYRDPYGEIFFIPNSCSLCRLASELNCETCTLLGPTALSNSSCQRFPTYSLAHRALSELADKFSNFRRFPPKNSIKMGHTGLLKVALEAFEARADFHTKVADLLETLPSKRFTKKGYIGFPEIQKIEQYV